MKVELIESREAIGEKGTIRTVPDALAKKWIAAGLAKAVKEKKKK